MWVLSLLQCYPLPVGFYISVIHSLMSCCKALPPKFTAYVTSIEQIFSVKILIKIILNSTSFESMWSLMPTYAYLKTSLFFVHWFFVIFTTLVQCNALLHHLVHHYRGNSLKFYVLVFHSFLLLLVDEGFPAKIHSVYYLYTAYMSYMTPSEIKLCRQSAYSYKATLL
jgi:hypothetical protein